MIADPALEFIDVSHCYGKTSALQGFSLELAKGELVCLLGPSGCGKTTTLRLAAGLEVLQQGEIRISGNPVAKSSGVSLPPEERDIGLVFQDYALFPHLTVIENVAFGVRKYGGEEIADKISHLLETLGIADLANRYPHALSGGQQQRVALARVLLPKPKLIMLDEPFSGLDTRLRDQIRDDTLHLLKQSGAAALLVTHDSEEAMFMGDRIVVISNGVTQQIGRPEEIYCKPTNTFVAEFFSEVNRINGFVENGKVNTIIGIIDSGNIAAGTKVEILIRPEAFRLTRPTNQSVEFLVQALESRMLGRSSLIHFCADGTNGEKIHFHARMPGRFLPEQNERLRLDIDPNQTFIFPKV